MAFLSARCFVGIYSLILIGLFSIFVYLMVNIDPIPFGYVPSNTSTKPVIPAADGRRNIKDMDELLFTIESPDKALDGIVYGPFPIVFHDPAKNKSLRSSDDSKYMTYDTQRVYPPLVPLVEIKDNKTTIKTMILSRLNNKPENKMYYRRSVDDVHQKNEKNKTLDVKIIDELGISRVEIRMPVDTRAGKSSSTVLNDLPEAEYNVVVNGREYKQITESSNNNGVTTKINSGTMIKINFSTAFMESYLTTEINRKSETTDSFKEITEINDRNINSSIDLNEVAFANNSISANITVPVIQETSEVPVNNTTLLNFLVSAISSTEIPHTKLKVETPVEIARSNEDMENTSDHSLV